MTRTFRTGDVVYVDFNGIGSQQCGKRYAVIVSNNIGNRFSPTVQVLPATTKRNNSNLPTHAHFEAGECGLPKQTVFLAESIQTINKFQILNTTGEMNSEQLNRVATAMLFALPITANPIMNRQIEYTNFLRVKEA